MTDEGRMPSNQSPAKQTPKKAADGQQNGAAKAGAGLPGLSAFSNMQGYTPVGRSAEADSVEPEPMAEPQGYEEPQGYAEPETDTSDASGDDQYAEQFAEDFVREFNQQEAPQEEEYASEEQGYASEEYEEGAGGYSSEEIQDYISRQNAEGEPQDYDVAAGYEGETDYAHADADAPQDYDAANSLQTFEAHYDQHPEIALSAVDAQGQAAADQPFFADQDQTQDADFLAGDSASAVAEPKERKGRKALMAASGLIAVLALGGALAFAYKIGGDSDIAKSGKPPLIQADNSPVKVAPENPGGKEFPHANKKIYERLGGEQKSEEVVTLKPRQEDVAAAATAAIGSTPATTPSVGGPRKVKTLTVRPDGTIEAPSDSRQKVVKAPAPSSSSAVSTAPDGTITMNFGGAQRAAEKAPEPAAAAPAPVVPTIPTAAPSAPSTPSTPAPAQAPVQTQQASVASPPANPAPPPVQKPAAPRVAAVAPAAAPAPAAAASAADGSGYVVQVAARKSQTDALAAFADIQQKYPRLLDGYRPIIKRADLGNKGVWYRLNVGPVESKQVASSLCSQLKSAGMRSCLVRAQ